MKVELTWLCIERSKAHRVDEWLRIINARMNEALKTLERREPRIDQRLSADYDEHAKALRIARGRPRDPVELAAPHVST